jgi:cell division protease FtsH
VSFADERIPHARFRDMAERGMLTEVQIREDTYLGRTKADGSEGRDPPSTVVTGRIEELEKDLLAQLDQRGVPYTRVGQDWVLLPFLVWLVPLLFAAVLFAWIAKRGGAAGATANPVAAFGKSRARVYVERGAPVTFGDVAGSAEAKAELREVVDFLKSPERFRRLGARVPKGVLLVGPPGTGKTLLARAVAGEAAVPFFHINGSEFVEVFVGVGASRVRDLFAQAREKPASIIFIDELDAVGKARSAGGVMQGNDEREQTLNQLLTEMDGFDASTGIIVVAATNRPETLDPALMRAGRFDRRVMVDRPDLTERREILSVHARPVLVGDDVDLGRVAAQTPGLVGADLANVVNEAALLAARRDADSVGQCDFDEAIERTVAGLERRGRRLGARERETVAYHEAGHALLAELLPTQDPVRKISIIPRGMGALGYTMQAPREDRYLMSRGEIRDRIVVLLGGRVAEEEIIGDISTGAQDDLAQATDLARRMVRELGMGETVGLSALGGARPMSFLGNQSLGAPRDYSDATARDVDDEVSRILGEAHTRASALLRERRSTLERIAKRLLEAETMGGDELRQLVAEAA